MDVVFSLAEPFAPETYREVGVCLWRQGCNVWSPLLWCTDAPRAFVVDPDATCTLLVIGGRINELSQECHVIVGTAELQLGGQSPSGSLEVKDPLHHTTQVGLKYTAKPRTAGQPLPGYMTLPKAPLPLSDLMTYTDAVSLVEFYERPPIEQLRQAPPVLSDFSSMLRHTMRTPFGSTIPILHWLQRMTRERSLTPPIYFACTAEWFLKSRDISVHKFLRNPAQMVEILQFVCAHHAWMSAYCRDECLEEKRDKFRGCDQWASGRWIQSFLRATDCEDNATDIVATFHTLCELDPSGVPHDPKHTRYALLRALRELARRYTPVIVDTVLQKDKKYELHLYVKLVPKTQWERLTQGNPPSRKDDELPILMIDSTKRTWSPAMAKHLSKAAISTLRSLHMFLRITACNKHDGCEDCQETDKSLLFDWAAPPELWHEQGRGLYHTDLRYYDVSSGAGAVYMPTLDNGQTIGVPALSLHGGSDWLFEQTPRHCVPMTGYKLDQVTDDESSLHTPVKLLNITDLHLESVSDVEEGKIETPLPPLRPITFDRVQRTIPYSHHHPEMTEFDLGKTVPVFLREVDWWLVLGDTHELAKVTTKRRMELCGEWLIRRCYGRLKMVRMECVYVQDVDPGQFVFVYYVVESGLAVKDPPPVELPLRR